MYIRQAGLTMASKTQIDKLDAQIKKILAEYGEDIAKNTNEAAEKIGKKGAQALKSSSASLFGSGPYSSGWKTDVDKRRTGTVVTIYNARMPGLAHLLENGHAKVTGGRVDGVSHIAPVEEKVNKEFEEAVENAIKGS